MVRRLWGSWAVNDNTCRALCMGLSRLALHYRAMTLDSLTQNWSCEFTYLEHKIYSGGSPLLTPWICTIGLPALWGKCHWRNKGKIKPYGCWFNVSGKLASPIKPRDGYTVKSLCVLLFRVTFRCCNRATNNSLYLCGFIATIGNLRIRSIGSYTRRLLASQCYLCGMSGEQCHSEGSSKHHDSSLFLLTLPTASSLRMSARG